MKNVTFLSFLVLLIIAGVAVADPDLLAEYRFSEAAGTNGGSTTADSAGSNNGTLIGNATIVADAGGNGKAASNVLYLDGTGDYVDLGTGTCIYPCGNPGFSEAVIAAWIRTTATAAGWKSIVSDGGNWRLSVGYNLVAFHPTHCGEVRAPSSLVNDGKWHHVTGTLSTSGDKLKLYVDGLLVNSLSVSCSSNGAWKPVHIGNNLGWPDRWFDGSLDDVRLYDRLLSDAEIADLAGLQLTLAREPSPVDDVNCADPNGRISWTPGDRAGDVNGHEVYFGISEANVTNATKGNPLGVYMGTDDVTGPDGDGRYSYDQGSLEIGQEYFWRVDEVNDPCTWTGNVWRFKAGYGPIVTIANNFNVPTFIIDANWFTIPYYNNGWTTNDAAPWVQHFADANTELFTFEANTGASDYYWGGFRMITWPSTDPDVWDYSKLDEFFQSIIIANPDAIIMPRIEIGTPVWWLEDPCNLDEMEVMDNGTTRSIYYSEYVSNPGVIPHAGPYASLASVKWRQTLAKGLENLLDYFISTGYSDHIFGYKLFGLDTNEWYPWSSGRNELSGYSVPTTNAFRDWLRDKYNDNVADLRTSWNNGTVTFENAEVPTYAERKNGESSLTFRDPAVYMNVIDWYQFYNELVVDTQDYFAGVIKNKTEDTKVIGAFYGFMHEFGGCAEFGHNALSKYLDSENLDFALVTASYNTRSFATGGDCHRSPSYSTQLRDKIWIHDNDLATFVSVTDIWPNRFGWNPSEIANETLRLGGTETAADTIEMMRRAMGFATCNGMYPNWFDLHGGIYEDPQLLAEVANLNNFRDRTKNYSQESKSEILIVSDELSTYYTTYKRYGLGLQRTALYYTAITQIKIGAPVDLVLSDDLGRIDASRYKLIIFQNCYHLSDSQRTMIDNLKGSDRVLVFCYAPGYFNQHNTSASFMQTVTGMNIVVSGSETLIKPLTQLKNPPAHPLGQDFLDTGYSTIGANGNYCKRMWVDDGGADTLGFYPDAPGNVNMAIKDMGSWESIYCVTPDMPAAVYRELARYAGVHIYAEDGDTFYANGSYLCLHADGPGTRTIDLPGTVDIYDALTEQLLQENTTSYTRYYDNGETMIYRYEMLPEIYVDADAPGNDDGTSWQNAYNHLSDALAVASSGNIIRMAEGTYNPDTNSSNPSGTGDRSASFELVDDVIILGGYAGFGEPAPGLRDPNTYPTILSGDLEADDVGFANNGENSYHVVSGIGVDETAVLDGFTITAGNANGSNADSLGGGVYNNTGSPTLIGCIIRGNTADNGAAIANENNSDIILQSCVLNANSAASNAGGIYNVSSNPIVTNSILFGNSDSGGSDQSAQIYGGTPVVNYCSIQGLTGSLAGTGNFSQDPCFVDAANFDYHITFDSPCLNAGDPAFIYTNQLDIDGQSRLVSSHIDVGVDEILPIKNLTADTYHATIQDAIDNASAADHIVVSRGIYSESINFNDLNVTLTSKDPNNSALTAITIIDGNDDGIAVTFENDEDSSSLLAGFTITDANIGILCDWTSPTITNCVIKSNNDTGIEFRFGASPAITNCIITGNGQKGIYAYRNRSYTTIENCTIVDNTGDGIYGYWDSDPIIVNCIIWDNGWAEINGGSVVTYSDIKGGFTGTGNIDTEPLFVDAAGGDYHLKSYSPCINAGDPAGSYTSLVDVDGQNRALYGRVDIGADEVYPIAGDTEPDKDVDHDDLENLYNRWLNVCLGPDWCGNCDTDTSGLVDLNDYANLATHWLFGI